MSKQKQGLTEWQLLTTLLLVAFIILKLCKVIDWSWWWVLSPFWLPIGIWLIFLIGGFLGITLASSIFLSKKDKFISEQKPQSLWQQRRDEMLANQKKIQELKNRK